MFGNRQDDLIILEVKELIGFLENISQRKIGDDFSELEFLKTYCKSAIVIIGKSTTILLEDTAPYTKYIRGYLYPHKFDTIYVLGDKTKKEVIDSVCGELVDIYSIVRCCVTKSRLHFTDGYSRAADTYIVILQNKNSSIYVH